MERRPSSLVCALRRPSQYVLPLGISLAMGLKEEGRSVWLVATLGPLGPGVKPGLRRAPTDGAEECRLIDAHQCRHRRGAHDWVEKLEQGPEKSGCFCVLLRWSIDRHGSSDLDAHIFGSHVAAGNQLSCSLPSGPNQPIVERACKVSSSVRPINVQSALMKQPNTSSSDLIGSLLSPGTTGLWLN